MLLSNIMMCFIEIYYEAMQKIGYSIFFEKATAHNKG